MSVQVQFIGNCNNGNMITRGETMSNTAMRRIARISKLTLASLVIGACVTINVNFPAAATEKAADKIIDAVTGTMGAAPAAARPLHRRWHRPQPRAHTRRRASWWPRWAMCSTH